MEDVAIRVLNTEEIEKLGIKHWPIWTKEISQFNWEYSDGTEDCYIIEGEVFVSTESGEYHIKPGDFVSFKSGLKCRWNIIKPIKKHYNFR